jgi:hypothetical protein
MPTTTQQDHTSKNIKPIYDSASKGIQKIDHKKGRKIPEAIRELNSKPIDYSNQVKLVRTGELKAKTVL